MGGENPSPADYQSLMSQIKDRPDFSVLQTILLRSMSQAVYGPEQKGHFGLAYDHYAHFTSPIRRYPDLLVHRGIKSIIYSKQACEDVRRPESLDLSRYRYAYDLAKMLTLGEHCSLAERRADEATRDVSSWLKCEYLQQHLGEVFEGVIAAVTGFGFFVELADLYVEGLVHVSSLNSDYYQYDAAKHRLIGERSGTRYGLGDRVVVEVSNINLDERKIDLLLVSAEPRSKAKKRRGCKVGRDKSRERAEVSNKPISEDKPARKPSRRPAKKDSNQTGKKPAKPATKARTKTKSAKKAKPNASAKKSTTRKPAKTRKP